MNGIGTNGHDFSLLEGIAEVMIGDEEFHLEV